MTPEEFKEARRSLGLSASQLALILDVSKRAIWRWENPEDAREPNKTACRVLRWMIDHGFRPPEFPIRPRYSQLRKPVSGSK